jgi:hypothetical protein
MDVEPRAGTVVSMAGLVCLCSSLIFSSCAAAHGGPVLGGNDAPVMNGTISGIVRSTSGPISARRVTATEVDTGAKYEASTATNGGYTMKVPTGKYRLDVELQPGEAVVESPGPLTINRSDLDAQRNFVIRAK